MRNWAGTYTYAADTLLEPTSIRELRTMVRRASHIRGLGSRHSFNAVADTTGTLVSTMAIPANLEIDSARRCVTFGAGTRYAVVADHLQREGWALHNMGSLPHISVGGAISTGTHGSGDLNGSLSTAVRALTFVDPHGELKTVSHADEEFAGCVVALGTLGILARITLAIEPSYVVRQDVYRGMSWDELLADPGLVTGAGYSVSIFPEWGSADVGEIWVKRRIDGPSTDPARTVDDMLLGARRDPAGTRQTAESGEDNTTQHGVEGAWSQHLPHFRIDRTPSAGDEIQTEYFVARANAAPALLAVRALATDFAEHLLISELRTVAADELWLSPAYQRDSLGLHFTWRNHPQAVKDLTVNLENALAPFEPRPHWGKVHSVSAARIRRVYTRLPDFRSLVGRWDPNRKFAGAYTDALLGLPGPG